MHAFGAVQFRHRRLSPDQYALGHQVGDQVLLDLCAVVQKQLGHEDLFGRIGDEEFSVLLVNASMTRAMALAESIRQAIAAMRGVFDQSDYHPNISGGITALADTDQSFADLFIGLIRLSIWPREMAATRWPRCWWTRTTPKNRLELAGGYPVQAW